MRFACEQCQTKYSIPDDRVRGKILKIRCKNCGCLISVSEGGVRTARPAEPAAGAAMAGLGSEGAGDGGDSTMIGGMADFFGKGFPPPESEEWHLSIDGNQGGPMPLADLAQRILEQAGSSAELYIWRDGFDDWKPADSVPEVQAAVEKARGAPKTPAAGRAPLPAPALSSLEADAGGDATQIGSLNLPLDLGKPEDKADDDVQDASMLSLDVDALEAFIETGSNAKPARPAPPPPKAPPPFKAPPLKPAAPPLKPAAPPPKPAAPPLKPAAAPGGPTPAKPLSKTLPHPGLRPPEPAPPAFTPAPPPPAPAPPPAAAPSPPPAAELAPPPAPAQAESVPSLSALLPPAPPAAELAPPPAVSSQEPVAMSGLGLGLSAPSFSSMAPPSAESPVPPRSILPLVIVIGLVLAGVGGGGYWLLTRPGRPLGPKIEATAPADAGTAGEAGDADAAKAAAAASKPDDKGAGKKLELEGLDEASFSALLESGEKALSKCYAKSLKKDASLAGTRLKVEVEVTAKGKSSEVTFDGRDSSDKLSKCVEKAIKKWKFPKGPDKKPYKARFPLTVSKKE